ncbi:hypothetical protein V8E53_012133 [Lactarius tabidus]
MAALFLAAFTVSPVLSAPIGLQWATAIVWFELTRHRAVGLVIYGSPAASFPTTTMTPGTKSRLEKSALPILPRPEVEGY